MDSGKETGVMEGRAFGVGKKGKHVTWADLIALVASMGAVMLPELLGAHAETWGELTAPEHVLKMCIAGLGILGAWANKYRGANS